MVEGISSANGSFTCLGKKKSSNWHNPTFWQTLCGFGKPPLLSPIKAPKIALASFIYIKKCQPGKEQWDFCMATNMYERVSVLMKFQHAAFSDSASEGPWLCFCLHQKVQPTRLMFQLQEQKTLLLEPQHDFMASSLGFWWMFLWKWQPCLRFSEVC